MNRLAFECFPRLIATVATLALATLPCRDAAAQARQQQQGGADSGAVTGTGIVTISRQPNVLRMTIELPAEGKDVAEAIANLKKERAELAGKLKKLGASGEAVTFGEPRVGGAAGGAMSMQQRMMRQVMRMQRAGNRAAAAAVADAAAAAAAPPKVAVSLTVTAEWPLEEQSPEESVVAGYTLREKLRAGGLAKVAEKKELTPEEQEEMEEMAMDDDESGAAEPGEPSFEFVARFTPEERDAATAEAFKKAQADAVRLAAAAGRSLGELRTVSGSASAESGGDDEYAYQRAMMIEMGMTPSGPSAEEATAEEPGPVELRVTVTAAFALK